jgi:hypothetical protein
MEHFKISFLPDATQEELLKACTGNEREAITSWNNWKQNADIDNLDTDSFNLIPLLYFNLSKFSVKDPLMPTLKGIYRRNWYLNKILFEETRKLLLEFNNNDIETILLKGAAWSFQFYQDSGARQMSDIDLLVPYDKIRIAISSLGSMGYCLEGKHHFQIPPDDFFLLNKELCFINEKKHKIDLHWFAMNGTFSEFIDSSIWKRSEHFDLFGSQTRVLSKVDSILHSLVHASFVSYHPPIRWIADTCFMMRSLSGNENWDDFIEEVRKRHVAFPVLEMLKYLKDNFCKEVPGDLIRRVNQIKFTRFEKYYYSIGRKGHFATKESFPMFFMLHLSEYVYYLKTSGKGMFSLLNVFTLIDYFKSKKGLVSRIDVLKLFFSTLKSRFSMS